MHSRVPSCAELSCPYRHCSVAVPAREGSRVAASIGPCTWLVNSGTWEGLLGCMQSHAMKLGCFLMGAGDTKLGWGMCWHCPVLLLWRLLQARCLSALLHVQLLQKGCNELLCWSPLTFSYKKQYTGATNNNMINSTVCVSRSRTLAASYYNRNVGFLQFRIQPFRFKHI